MKKGLILGLLALLATQATVAGTAEVVVYTARKIITMEPALPEATAVAVADGRIVSVGTLESLKPWLAVSEVTIDRSLEDKVLLPGFIDPHVHPSLPAVLTQFPFLAPDDWVLPTGDFPGARTPKAYEAGLKALPDTPVMLWHRSFHELIGNDTAFAMLGITQDDTRGSHENDWARGHFWENGLKAIVPKMGFLFEPARFGQGMANFLEMVHLGGVTTVLDMGTGVFGNPAQEIALVRQVTEGSQAPLRIIMTPIITDFLARGKTPEQAMAEIEQWRAGNSHRVMVQNHFKLMLDGAIFSGLAQMGPPGYLDGHEGIWMAPLPVTTQWARAFWNAGYQLHAHTNGDKSAAAFIELLRSLQAEKPRSDHRFTLEHFAYSTQDQSRQLKALGAVVSANPYYHYLLSDMYSELWLGEDRGTQMVRLGSLERLEVPFALHSDSPMAPLSPLTLAWNATNRVTINGTTSAVEERISLNAALRAITTDAAWIVGWENEIGSIRAGKRADFTVLEADPYEVGVAGLKDIQIWGTVFEGKAHPLTSNAK
jgi:predicted amidohydrolase YtcJ